MGILFGKRVVTEKGERWEGAVTKTSRKGQKYDTDGLGSDVIISVDTHSGLRPERFAEDLFRRNGINPNAEELATASATGPVVLTVTSPVCCCVRGSLNCGASFACAYRC